MDWTTLANIGTVFQTVVVSMAAVYGFIQLRDMLKSRHLQATIELLDILGAEDVVTARRAVHRLTAEPAEVLEADWIDIDRLSKSYNRAGWLLSHGLVDREMLLDMYCESILLAWDKLQEYIVYAREVRRFPRWQRQFQLLAREARNYADSHGYVSSALGPSSRA